MRTYSRAAVIGLLSGASVVFLACFGSPWLALGFTTAVLSAMVISTAKGIA